MWAADNQAFTRGFDPGRFFPWLEMMRPYRARCLFVVCPDAPGDRVATRQLWERWSPCLADWPLAYVAQDGETDIPRGAQTLFLGGKRMVPGRLEWKRSQQAADLIQLALRRGLHVHIGRVNWGAAYRHFQLMRGSETFTCDGTRTRWDGRETTLRAWNNYQLQTPLLRL
ncbi:MAG: hypothetical protein WHX53_15560 [Anaerolineae bacterium]